MNVNRAWLLLCFLILLATLVISLPQRETGADPGGPDDGLLHLAGATSLMHSGSYPIIQRPPVYSLLLELLARTQAVDLTDTTPAAQELGSLDTFPVAQALLQPGYLRLVLWMQVALWAGTLLLLALTLRLLKIGWRGVYAAVLLAVLPSSWRMTGAVSETILAQLLVMVAVVTLFQALKLLQTESSSRTWIAPGAVSGLAFALLALTRATFQLLAPVILVLMLVLLIWRERGHLKGLMRFGLVFLLPWVVVVGGWSLHNRQTYGFFGVSGVSGVALSTRTALYLEQAAGVYPEEAAIFTGLRDQLFLDTASKNDVVYWGARASNWLMGNRGMSYVETNRLLTAFNLRAIIAAPLNYLDTVAGSLIYFHFPGVTDSGGMLVRLGWSAVEFALMGALTCLTLLWLALGIFAWRGWIATRHQPLDTVIAVLLAIFWYTALISSAIDVGKPEHRMAIQGIIPLIVVLIWHRMAALPRHAEKEGIAS